MPLIALNKNWSHS